MNTSRRTFITTLLGLAGAAVAVPALAETVKENPFSEAGKRERQLKKQMNFATAYGTPYKVPTPITWMTFPKQSAGWVMLAHQGLMRKHRIAGCFSNFAGDAWSGFLYEPCSPVPAPENASYRQKLQEHGIERYWLAIWFKTREEAQKAVEDRLYVVYPELCKRLT